MDTTPPTLPLPPLRRRAWLAALAAAALPVQAQPSPPSAAVLDFDLLDDHPNPATQGALPRRLQQSRDDVAQALHAQGLYRVVPLDAARELIDRMRNEQEHLHRCEDCARRVGQRLGVDYAVTGWVQKVSELILNLNLEVHDVKRERVVLSKSVDLRGNNDESWQRAARFLVRDMAERRQRNPRYGL